MNEVQPKIHKKKSSSVIWRIVFIYSCICIIPMFIFIGYIYSMASDNITENAHNALSQSLVNTKDSIEEKIETIEASSSELVSNKVVVEFLETDFSYTGEEIVYFRKLVFPFFSLRTIVLPGIDSIWIYGENETTPISWSESGGFLPMSYYPYDLEDNPENTDYWWTLRTDNIRPVGQTGDSSEMVYSFSHMIRSSYNASIIGVADFQISVDVLFEAIADADNNISGTLYLVDNDGAILFTSNTDNVGSKLSDIYTNEDNLFTPDSLGQYNAENNSYIVESQYLSYLECSIVSVRQLADIQSDLRKTTFWMVLGIIGTTAIMIALVTVASFGIMKRVRRLVAAMHRVDEGDYSILVNTGPNDEFGHLINTFNGMIQKINTLINNVYRIKIREKEAELRALEAQVNPHFLYNTLTSIAGAAKQNNDNDAYKMAISMGKFYRLGLSNKAKLITVSDELEYLNMYLTIQKTRFKNRINYLFDIDEHYLDCKLIRNIFQPLVENAISHGLIDKLEGGVITIRMTADEDDNLLFEVRDNGAGLDPEQINAINAGEFVSDGTSGYGLKNINDRLKIYYGEDYRLYARSQMGEETSFFVSIPMRW